MRYGASVESTRAFETVSWSLTSALSPTIGLFMKGLAKPPFKFPDMLWPMRKFPFKHPYQMHEWLARLHTHIHSGYDLVPQTEHVQRVEGDGNPDRSPWWGGHIKGIAVSIYLLGGVIDEVWFVLRSEGKWVRRIGRKRQGGRGNERMGFGNGGCWRV